jgi:cardiolipin synthase
LIETFIWFEDDIGTRFADKLIAAAKRGSRVRVTADGYGSPVFSSGFLRRLKDAGVQVRSFDPQPTFFSIRTNLLCRLHRKLAVIDNERAFVGGINISDEHLKAFGAASKQDYAVELRGPVVQDVRDCCTLGAAHQQGRWWRRWRYWLRRFPRELKRPEHGAKVLFAARDNDQHPTDIETLYRLAIHNAKRDVIIANAYFFPGFRFIRDLRRAAERGVDVKLIMQGNPDRPFAVGVTSILYDDLLAAGVKIYRYVERPLHAKVAVVDEHWSTVGSSNLDPTSLGLNYEANIFALDREFNASLRTSLERLISRSCREVTQGERPAARGARRALAAIAYHLTRRMPTWGRRWLNRGQRTSPM